MERTLEVTISVTDKEEVFVSIYDNDSGDHVTKRVDYSQDEHPEFDQWIGNEIYDWIEFCLEDD